MVDVINRTLGGSDKRLVEAFNLLGDKLEGELTKVATRLQAQLEALKKELNSSSQPIFSRTQFASVRRPVGTTLPTRTASAPSGSAPPPPPPNEPPLRAPRSASPDPSSHHSSPRPSRKNKGKGRAAESGDPNPEDESSSHDSDDSVSSSSDSDLFDAFFDFMRRRRRTTTSSPRLLFDYRTAAAATRESKVNSSLYFRMKRGEDYRSYVEDCECYMDLQASRFPTEKHRVI
jgi:hypothetical protein